MMPLLPGRQRLQGAMAHMGKAIHPYSLAQSSHSPAAVVMGTAVLGGAWVVTGIAVVPTSK